MTAEITISVHGTPAPQGSKRHVGNGVMVESSAKVKPWRSAVRDAAEKTDTPMMLGPLAIDVTFLIQRPRGHYGTGRNTARLRESAPAHPAVKPDIDKLLRSTLDALTESGIYRDDAQIVIVGAAKQYTRRLQVAGALITIREVWEQEP
jgi:crossover junction endodeoxyribonuclease RusA